MTPLERRENLIKKYKEEKTMSKCDSCTHKEVCSLKMPFQDFEKSKTSGEYPKPDIVLGNGSMFSYNAVTTGKTIIFSVEVKCSEYREEKPILRDLQSIYGNLQTGPFYK